MLRNFKNYLKYLLIFFVIFALRGTSYGIASYQVNYGGTGYELCNASCNCGSNTCYSYNGYYHDTRCGGASFTGFIISGSPAYTTYSCGSFNYWTQCSVPCCTPTNGGWSGWNYGSWSWGACSAATCTQSGTRTNTRSCNNPTPSCGGANCSGSSTQTENTTQGCTNAGTTPVAPTTLTLNALVTPSITKATIQGGPLTFGWNNGTGWGTNCAGLSKINTLSVSNGAGFNFNTTISPSGDNARSYSNSLSIVCNGSYTWTVTKNNGWASASANSTFNVSGFAAPVVTSVTPSASNVIKQNAINFSVAATDDGGLFSIAVTLVSPSGPNIVLTPQNVSGTSVTRTFTWTPPCNAVVGTYTVQATATDSCGVASAVNTATFTVSDPAVPVITDVSSTDPDALVATRVAMPLSATASGVGLTSVQIFISQLASATGPVVNASYATGPVQYCGTTPCTSTYSWTPPCGTPNGYYSARAVGRHSCGNLSVGGPTYVFEVENSYNLSVTTNTLNGLIASGTSPDCTAAKTARQSISVTLQTDPTLGVAYPYNRNLTSGAGNTAFFSIIPAHASTVRVTSASYTPGQCRGFDFYCAGNTPQVSTPSISFTGSADCSTKTTDISLVENKRPAWATLLDGNAYAKSANLSIGCTAMTVGGGFVPTFINTSPTGRLGGSLYTAGDISALDNRSIYYPFNGYSKNLDPTLSTPLKSSDNWINNYAFPTTIPTYAVPATNLSTLSAANPVIYINGSLTAPSAGFTSALSGAYIVYVNGNFTIYGPITSANALITFIVNGNVSVAGSVGTSAPSLTTSSTANIKAGIISMGNITFPQKSTPPDNPLLIEGFLMSKGTINFNRDLGVDNSWYPSTIVRFDRTAYSKFNTLMNARKTGIETYDVQWIYD